METEELFRHYQQLQRYVNWSDDDVRRVQAILPLLRGELPLLIDDFYEEIDRHPEARRVITGGEAQVQRLKGALRGWLEDFFSGNYDFSYVVRRWKVGWRHVEIGLHQVYTNVALSRLRDGLVRLLVEHWRGDMNELAASIRSLNKLLDLDLAMIEAAYQAEYQKRHQLSERLAAIGQISGGVAHELRNPLNVIKTSVYFLRNSKNPSPEKTAEHLQRIERQVEVADAVTRALSDFARLPIPALQPLALRECLEEVLEITALPDHIDALLDCPSDIPRVLGDRYQLTIVFGNLIRNARDAMPDGGTLRVAATSCDPRVRVDVHDNGSGIKPDDLHRIYEPLFSTKPRGMGLGLAITRSILDKHGAILEVNSSLGVGSTFSVSIPMARESANHD